MDNNNLKGFLSNWIVKNILLAVLFFIVLVIAAQIALSAITHHGKTVEVPDFTSMTVDNARQEARAQGLKVEVTDSIFVKQMERGAIKDQNPKPGDYVKKGRRIKLTINAVTPKKVVMPNLNNMTLSEARGELNSCGLSIGRLIFVNDFTSNRVLRQLYHNREIRPGRKIDSGSEIDLEVSYNGEDSRTMVPDVKGMKYLRAIDAIHDHSLNVKKIVFDDSVRNFNDTINAVVYKQSPLPSKASTTVGTGVSIYLSVDKDSK